jgi:hypothetical protein
MIEYLVSFCLILLTIGHGILIRGCFNIHQEIPQKSNSMIQEFSGIKEVLTECLDCLDVIAAEGVTNSKSVAGESIQQVILSSLMNKMMMPGVNGETQEQVGAVQETANEKKEQVQESN